jgi:hypothetical protein
MQIAEFLDAKVRRLQGEAQAQKKVETFELRKTEQTKQIKKDADQLEKLLKEKKVQRDHDSVKLIENSIAIFREKHIVDNNENSKYRKENVKNAHFKDSVRKVNSRSVRRPVTESSIDADEYLKDYNEKGFKVARKIREQQENKKINLIEREEKVLQCKVQTQNVQEQHINDLASRYINKITSFDARQANKEQKLTGEIAKRKIKGKDAKQGIIAKIDALEEEAKAAREKLIEEREERMRRVEENRLAHINRTQKRLKNIDAKWETNFIRAIEINEGNVF